MTTSVMRRALQVTRCKTAAPGSSVGPSKESLCWFFGVLYLFHHILCISHVLA